jgi:hypothetical protein
MTNTDEIKSIRLESEPMKAIHLKLVDAYLCGDDNCRSVSNCQDFCPSCRGHVTPVSALVEGKAKELAFEIARDSAKTDIDSYSVPEFDIGCKWYDTTPRDDEANSQMFVDRAITFLDMIGELIHHPAKQSWVRW